MLNMVSLRRAFGGTERRGFVAPAPSREAPPATVSATPSVFDAAPHRDGDDVPCAGTHENPSEDPAATDGDVLVMLDDVSPAGVGGWASDARSPLTPVVLRFRLEGEDLGEVVCDASRPDVAASGRPTDRVGFGIVVPERLRRPGAILTAETAGGRPVSLMVEGLASPSVALEVPRAVAATASPAPVPAPERRVAERRAARLGIGVVTFNRVASMQRTVEAIRRHTSSPYQLVVASDGSTDGTAELLEEMGVARVCGENRGVCWNKNRLLYFMTNVLDCDVVLLLEDDCRPVSFGWELPWVEAARRLGHVNFAGAWLSQYFLGGAGTAEDPIRAPAITGQCVGFSRKAIQRVGYFDTRFRGYGHGHVEHSSRMVRAGFGGERGAAPDGSDVFWLISAAFELDDNQSFRDEDQVRRNSVVRDAVDREGCHRWAWRTDADMAAFTAEMDAAEATLERARFVAGSDRPSDRIVWLDEVGPGRLRGWAVDRLRPDAPLFLRFVLSGETVWEGVADGPRPDLLDAGIGTERAGFETSFDAPGGGVRILSVLDGEGRELPITVDGRTSSRVLLRNWEDAHV